MAFSVNFEDLNIRGTVLDSGDVKRSKIFIQYLLSTNRHCVMVITLCELTYYLGKWITKSQCGVWGAVKEGNRACKRGTRPRLTTSLKALAERHETCSEPWKKKQNSPGKGNIRSTSSNLVL